MIYKVVIKSSHGLASVDLAKNLLWDDIGGREIPKNIFNVLGCHCTSENKSV